MKKLVLGLILLSLSIFAWATIDEFYSFNATTGTYSPITGTAIEDMLSDDALSAAIPLGFTFPYGENTYTEIKVSSNGWIGLGSSQTGSNLSNNLTSTTINPVIAPLWDDTSMAEGSAAYQLSGTAPNRIFTVQYTNLKWNYGGPAGYIMQVRLHEDGKIELIYGANGGAPNNPSASIGINMLPGGTGMFYSVTPGTPATASMTAETSNISSFPDNGTIYQFIPVEPADNDLAAQTISGNITPSLGAATNYTVAVYNRGANSQSTYTVQIIDAANTVLASVAGPTLAPGATSDVVVAWTPAAEGPYQLRGKVVLAGDENPNNDLTSPISVVVQPQGITSITVGAGDQTARIPVDMFYRASMYETLYYPDELSMFGVINTLTFYNSFTSNLPSIPTKVWLGTTDQQNLTNGWINASELTLVFDGNVDYPSGQNNIMIPLQTPFTYAGGNLVMLVKRPYEAQYHSFSDNFLAQTVGTDRARKMQNDSTDYDENNLTGGTLSGQFPKTTFNMSPLSPDPIFFVGPSEYDYGQVLLGQSSAQLFRTGNMGGGSLGINSISISGDPTFTLENLPTLPANLTTGQTVDFIVRYTPTTAGEHTATITITDNLARTTHNVEISGTGFDATVYTLPYSQNWDDVTAPALPLGWGSIVQSTSTSAFVGTYNSATYAHSAPNSLRLYNPSDAEATLLAVGPMLDESLDASTVRLRFWARSSGANYPLSIGVLTDPANAATYTEISQISLTTTVTEYTVNLTSYTGDGAYISFKHGLGGTGRSIYIDDVTFEQIAPNDLACEAIIGNSTPSVNSSSTYTLSIKNWGTATQSTYTVKLFDGNDVELASVAGLTVEPDQTVEVPISWTPTAPGPMSLYGSVALAGDINPENNNSPALHISVQPEGIITQTIGEGNLAEGIPWEFYYKNSLFQTLYYPQEVGMYGNITTIQFYNNFVTNLTNMPIKIWLGSTTLEDLSGGWITPDQLTLVYDGTMNFPSGENAITIPLQVPYAYTGGNLVLYAHRPMDTQYYSSSDNFKAQTWGTNRARKLYSDSTVYDPAAPPDTGGTVSGTFPQTTLIMTPLSNDPLMAVNPTTINYGQILLGATATRNVIVTNVGGAPLGINQISLSTTEHYSLGNIPNLPATLNTGETLTVPIVFDPQAAGTHAATLTVVDNQGRSQNINLGARNSVASRNTNRVEAVVNISGEAIDATITSLPYTYGFDDVTPPALPIQWSKLIQSTASTLVQTYTTTPQSPPNTAGMTNSSDAEATAILIAPPLSTEIPVNTTRLKFWARGSSAGYSLQVGVMSNPTSAASFTLVQNLDLSSTWTEYIVPLTGYSGGGTFVAFKHGLGGTYRTIYIDTVTLELVAPNDLGAISIAGNATPTVGLSATYVVNVQNWGTNAQSDYDVKLFDGSNNELTSVAGPAINPGQIIPVEVPWVPTQEGALTIYGKVVLDGDANTANDQTSSLSLVINPAGVITITVGDGSSTGRIPVDMFYKNSLFETLYYPAEMGNFMGQITAISFYNSFNTDLPNMPTKVWIGTTTQADLSADWIPAGQLTPVFDGTINYPSGENVITIPFDEPYLYLNGENLVLMVNRPMDTQYYSSSDTFITQTVGTNRARNMYSDSTTYDPNAPTGGTASGSFPKTTFMVIPGGVGDIYGTVTNADDEPLQGVSVQLVDAGYQTTTNAAGEYSLLNVLPNNYTISFSAYGYITHTQQISLEEDQELTVNAQLNPMPQVTVSGIVFASDTGAALNGASISLTGYADYSANSNATGAFTIPNVYAGNSYFYSIVAPGYSNETGTIEVGSTNHNMGTITLAEVAYSPGNLEAAVSASGTAIELSWIAPDPNALNITEGFEEAQFPPLDWSIVVTNPGAPNPSGVAPSWSRFSSATIGTEEILAPEGSHQAGLWWAYEHQDEWLITPSFYCPSNATLSVQSYVYLGSTAGDHYYVKVSTDNGNSWTALWDASAQTGGWNYYATPITVDLAPYSGSSIKLAFHAVDPPSNDGLWYVWFIDDMIISNQDTRISFEPCSLTKQSASPASGTSPATLPSRFVQNGHARTELSLPLPTETTSSPRSLVGYKVWRLAAGSESNPDAWTELTADMIDETEYLDEGWTSLADGDYRWAVRAIYTADVASNPVFSNILQKETITGMISGVVRQANNQPIPGATVTAGEFTATTNGAGAYVLIVPIGTYTVSASATGFATGTHEDVVVNPDQTTTVNFVLQIGSSSDEDIMPVTATALKGNYPNPFNPSTTISYSVKDPAHVKIEIYNLKGQRITTLVDADHNTGNYSLVWNGQDASGRSVGSGIYFYRMQAGSFQSTRKMMLME